MQVLTTENVSELRLGWNLSHAHEHKCVQCSVVVMIIIGNERKVSPEKYFTTSNILTWNKCGNSYANVMHELESLISFFISAIVRFMFSFRPVTQSAHKLLSTHSDNLLNKSFSLMTTRKKVKNSSKFCSLLTTLSSLTCNSLLISLKFKLNFLFTLCLIIFRL